MNDLRCILLVEDDPNDVLLLERACKKASVARQLKVVADGEEAVAYLQGVGNFGDREGNPIPTLVLLDLKLPRKSGLELLAWIREQEGPLKRLPVVVLTSSRQLVDINLAYDLGANSYLVKPGKFESLLVLVKKLEEYWFGINEDPEVDHKQ